MTRSVDHARPHWKIYTGCGHLIWRAARQPYYLTGTQVRCDTCRADTHVEIWECALGGFTAAEVAGTHWKVSCKRGHVSLAVGPPATTTPPRTINCPQCGNGRRNRKSNTHVKTAEKLLSCRVI